MDEQVKNARRRGVESVDMAGDILKALLHFPGGARLKELEKVTGVVSATLHRYLLSLIRCGLVQRAEGSNRYEFGLLAYQIGQVTTHSNDLVSLMSPLVAEFSERIGETAAIGVWLDRGVTMARWFEANSSIRIALRPGIQVPLTRSSTGRVFAAYLAREKTNALIQAEVASSEHFDWPAYETELERIRCAGVCRVRGQHIKGIASVSVPIFDFSQNLAAVLAVITNESSIGDAKWDEIEAALRELADRISKLLGHA